MPTKKVKRSQSLIVPKTKETFTNESADYSRGFVAGQKNEAARILNELNLLITSKAVIAPADVDERTLYITAAALYLIDFLTENNETKESVYAKKSFTSN